MTQAITPVQAKQAREAAIPVFVFECFNELIAANLRGDRASFLQKDVVALILQKAPAASIPESGSQATYLNRWLDVSEHYRRAGWKVDHDVPGYNESYDAVFTFTEA